MSSDKKATFKQFCLSENDTNFDRTNLNAVSSYPISVLSTVEHNKGYFKKRKIEEANADMDLPNCILWNSPTKLNSIVNSGQLKNNNVTVEVISRAKYIHGKLVGFSKGKIIRQKNRCTHKYIGSHYLKQFFSSTKMPPLNGIFL